MSSRQGPEPQAIATYKAVDIKELHNNQLIFVGTRNPGMIAVYSMSSRFHSFSRGANFQSLYYGGRAGRKKWHELWEAHMCGDLSPTDLK